MREKNRTRLRPVLFAAGGAAAGFLWYRLIGCRGGSCSVASNPFLSMGYLALVGLLLAGVFSGEGDRKCNT